MDCPDETIDEDGYPTEAFLAWLKAEDDHIALIDTVIAYFVTVAYGAVDITSVGVDAEAATARNIARTRRQAREGVTHRVFLTTGGWSGCEDVIGALQDNLVFWHNCWAEHHRGGGWVFEVKGFGVTAAKD